MSKFLNPDYNFTSSSGILMDTGEGGAGAGFGVESGSASIGMPGTSSGLAGLASPEAGTVGLTGGFGNAVGTGFGEAVGVGTTQSGGFAGVPGSLAFYSPTISEPSSLFGPPSATPTTNSVFGYAGIPAGPQATALADQTSAFGDFGEAATLGAAQSVDPSAGPGIGTTIAKGLAGLVNPLAPFGVQLASNAMNDMSAGYGMASGLGGLVGGTLGASTGIPGLGQLGGQLGASMGSQGFGGGLGGTPGIAGQAAGGGLGGTNITLMDLVRGGIGFYQADQNAEALERLARQQAEMADPFRNQRGAAVNYAQQYAQDPSANPLYRQSLADAERALARRQAASGNYFSGRALESAAQLPASVLANLQNQSITNQGQIASAAGGAPATAAQLYGQSATGAAAADASRIGALFEPYEQRQSEQSILAMLRGG